MAPSWLIRLYWKLRVMYINLTHRGEIYDLEKQIEELKNKRKPVIIGHIKKRKII